MDGVFVRTDAPLAPEIKGDIKKMKRQREKNKRQRDEREELDTSDHGLEPKLRRMPHIYFCKTGSVNGLFNS